MDSLWHVFQKFPNGLADGRNRSAACSPAPRRHTARNPAVPRPAILRPRDPRPKTRRHPIPRPFTRDSENLAKNSAIYANPGIANATARAFPQVANVQGMENGAPRA